jgi:hypothetical protein
VPERDFFTVNVIHTEAYLNFLQTQGYPLKSIRSTHAILNRFYRFAVHEKWTLINPFEKIQMNREAESLTVCSEETVRNLFTYLKSEHSNPEHAFLISLVLFFGLTTQDLMHATVSTQNQSALMITLRRTPRTKGRRYYNREQVLTLPQSPLWFLRLQKRFFKDWCKHHHRIKQTFPRASLLLPYNDRSNRPLRGDAIRERVYQATVEAVGYPICIRVLRQTCGHLHSRHEDASLLTRLGWSQAWAFHYTWLPRKYHFTQD